MALQEILKIKPLLVSVLNQIWFHMRKKNAIDAKNEFSIVLLAPLLEVITDLIYMEMFYFV